MKRKVPETFDYVLLCFLDFGCRRNSHSFLVQFDTAPLRGKNAARAFHNSTDERINIMQMPFALKPAIWGAVAGAAALAIVGFSWGGWVSHSSAELLANQKAATAVASALAPICLENFRRAADAPAKLLELRKANSWEQVGFIEKGGWARMPGLTAIDPVMARACATLIISDKS